MSSDDQEQIPFKGEDITPTKDGCLLKEIVREGSDEEKPWFDDKVSIHYTGTLLDGTVFNTSRNQDEKFSFNLGRGEVIKAWDMGVATMKRGEIARFFSKPKYAYGLKGLPGKVESATSVIFEIELVDCIGKDISEERDESILRRVIKRGEGHEPVNEDSVVEVNLKGTHQGEVFDERTVTFIAGAGCVENIPLGVERAIFRMTKGEHCKLYLKSKGAKGVEKFNIPPGSSVEYDVTVTKLDRAKEERTLSEDQKLEVSEILKKRADEFVKGGYYELAVKRYKTVFHYLLSATMVSERDRQRSWELKFHSQANLALCYLKLGEYAECKRSCETALAHDPKHEKSIFRRGQCQLAQRNFDKAINDFEEVLEINPSNVEAKKQIEECHRQIRAHRVDEKEMYGSFFKKPPKKNTIDKNNESKSNEKENKTSTEST